MYLRAIGAFGIGSQQRPFEESPKVSLLCGADSQASLSQERHFSLPSGWTRNAVDSGLRDLAIYHWMGAHQGLHAL